MEHFYYGTSGSGTDKIRQYERTKVEIPVSEAYSRTTEHCNYHRCYENTDFPD